MAGLMGNTQPPPQKHEAWSLRNGVAAEVQLFTVVAGGRRVRGVDVEVAFEYVYDE